MNTNTKNTSKAALWEVKDLTFTTSDIPIDPFNIAFGAVFIHKTGKTVTVPGFYNGNTEYIVRVSLPEFGSWTYNTYSNLAELASKSGNLVVESANGNTKHGPVVISSENKQRFAYADGTPYFALPFEADWLFALDHDNSKGIPKTKVFIDTILVYFQNAHSGISFFTVGENSQSQMSSTVRH